MFAGHCHMLNNKSKGFQHLLLQNCSTHFPYLHGGTIVMKQHSFFSTTLCAKVVLKPGSAHTHTHHFIVRHTPHCLSFLRCSLTIYDCQKDGQTRIRRACLLAPPAENRGTCHFVLCEFHGQNDMRRAGDTRCIVGQCVYAIQSYLLVSVCNTRSCFHPEPKLLKRT